MAKGKQTILFPSNVVNTSNSFSLKDDVSVITLVGMQAGDSVLVEVEVGANECDKRWVSYNPHCCQAQFNYPQNQFFLHVPNKYRLLLTNATDLHLTDPSHFENVEIYQTPVDSDSLSANLLQGCSDMSCNQTGVTSVSPSATGAGWDLVSGSSSIPIVARSADGTLEIVGNNFEVDVDALATKICNTNTAKEILQECLGGDDAALCASMQAMPVNPNRIGG